MVNRIVEDIRKALDNNLFFVALASALTLPDVCGKVEYPNEVSSRKRYIGWYNKEIGITEKNPVQYSDEEMPYASGEVMYSLRCAFLHEGNPNVNNDNLESWESLPIDHFVLKTESKNEYDFYSDTSEISIIGGQHRRSYTMSIRNICLKICAVAESYYEENKEQFNFDYEILDWDEVTSEYEDIDSGEFIKHMADNIRRKRQKEV